MSQGSGGRNQIGIGSAATKFYNTTLTDVHLILTVVLPQMEMFFLLPLCRDEVVGPLFVTRPDVLWMSSFIHSTFGRVFFYSSVLPFHVRVAFLQCIVTLFTL
jgi:hypothetical protein